MSKIRLFFALVSLLVITLPSTTYAHVTVTPATAETATMQKFTVTVPNEEDVPVSNIRLIIPESITDVTPTSKSGWTIDLTKNADAIPRVTEISWSGSIPADLRDEFTFMAKTPSNESTLVWKAYQTYADGKIVSWDATPKTGGDEHESETSGPYSTTAIAKSAVKPVISPASESKIERTANRALGVSILATLLGTGAIALSFKKRR